MLIRGALLLTLAVLLTINFTSGFALTEMERTAIDNPRLENTLGTPIIDNINVNQQIQISADITNNQKKSQNFVYLVQIKNEHGIGVSLGWFSGQLTPDQKLSPSLSWISDESGEYTAEIFVWEGLRNHNALSEYTTLQISVS